MRPVAPLVFALALIAPLSLFGFSSGDAFAGKPKKGKPAASAKASSGSKKNPEIKLKDTAVPGSEDTSSAQASGAPPPTRGPARIDFDDRLVQGQTNKSGAVYLYDRKELKTRSMVKKRESFREEIIGAVYDSDSE